MIIDIFGRAGVQILCSRRGCGGIMRLFLPVDSAHFDDAKQLKLNLMQQDIHSRSEWISSARPENPRIVTLHIGHDSDVFKMCWTLWGKIFFAAVIDIPAPFPERS